VLHPFIHPFIHALQSNDDTQHTVSVIRAYRDPARLQEQLAHHVVDCKESASSMID
jgi:hypothetical protein